jgi:hypothetical protein
MPNTKEYQRAYREKNREKLREYHRIYQARYNEKIENKYKRYRINAEKRGYEFNLTFKQFEIVLNSGSCFYCGATEKLGVDRIDNQPSYTFGRVVACCGKCNKIKNIFGFKDFLNQIRKIVKVHKDNRI